MIKCIIVDDEPLAQQVLEKHIRQTAGIELLKKCGNALEAFDIISKTETDLMFLDIKMPSLDGIRFLKTLKNPPKVIFTTAFSEYAAESYELDAVDYLLKPITYERFSKSVAKFLHGQVQSKPEPSYSYFKINGKLVKIPHSEIIYAQCTRDYIILNTTNGRHITHMTMKYLLELLPENLFSRVHRSFMINRLHIKKIGKNEIEAGNAQIPVSKNYKSEVQKLKHE